MNTKTVGWSGHPPHLSGSRPGAGPSSGIWTDFWRFLACPNMSNFFLCQPRMNIFLFDYNDLYLNVLTSSYFFLDLHLHCQRGQTRAIPVQIHCPHACGAGAVCPWQPARPKLQESGFHVYITFCYISPPISHLVIALSHLFVALSRLFTGVS